MAPIWRCSTQHWNRSTVVVFYGFSAVTKPKITQKHCKTALKIHHELHHYEFSDNSTLHISYFTASSKIWKLLYYSLSGTEWAKKKLDTCFRYKTAQPSRSWMSARWSVTTRWGNKRFILPQTDRSHCGRNINDFILFWIDVPFWRLMLSLCRSGYGEHRAGWHRVNGWETV